MAVYLQVDTRGPGPLFRHLNGSPLTIVQFRALFYRAVQWLGLPAGVYSLHSFRIGAATEASCQELPPVVIQRLGRWQSGAFRYYIRDPPNW